MLKEIQGSKLQRPMQLLCAERTPRKLTLRTQTPYEEKKKQNHCVLRSLQRKCNKPKPSRNLILRSKKQSWRVLKENVQHKLQTSSFLPKLPNNKPSFTHRRMLKHSVKMRVVKLMPFSRRWMQKREV